ncbi:MAG: acyl-CoA dehydrogenase family protein [Desulfobacteraceae bacterium]|jgi:alkylation response protein AidB-like acyl-CoA dehydrogenase
MIPYELNEDQKLFQETIRRMAKERLAPGAQDVDQSSDFPWDLYALFKENGLPGINIPEEYGGAGADRLTTALVLEEMGKTCNTSAIILGVFFLSNLVITLLGNEEQKRRFLPGIANGESICAISLIEPGINFDTNNINTTAISGDDHYLLNGKAPFISNADVADFLMVLAKDGHSQGTEAIDFYVVEKKSSGYAFEKKGELLGEGSRQACEVVFKDCKVSGENRFTPDKGGVKAIMKILKANNFMTAARALGLAQGAFDHALEYAKTRVQFGRPIAKFQGIQFLLAEMAAKIEAVRQLLYKACTEMDKGSKEAIRLGAMAKSFACDVAMDVSVDSVQIFGAYGVSREYPVSRYYRNAKLVALVEGTSDLQKRTTAKEIIS